MTDISGYRRRSGLVRGRARAQLAALRRERLKRKARRPIDDPVAGPADPDPVLPGRAAVEAGTRTLGLTTAALPRTSDAVPDNAPDPGQGALADAACAAETDTGTCDPPPGMAVAAPETPVAGEDGARTADAALGGPPDTGTHPEDSKGTGPAGGGEIPDAPGEAALPTAPAAARSDLHDLPGVGSGFVWLLEGAGVSSLADLAGARSEDLSRRMGRIAELVDLDYWIGIARARTRD